MYLSSFHMYVRKRGKCAREIAPVVTSLLCKSEDSSSIPSTHITNTECEAAPLSLWDTLPWHPSWIIKPQGLSERVFLTKTS